MTEEITNALLITAIGMGLVFQRLILLRGLMAMMVRMFADRPEPVEAAPEAVVSVTQVTEPTFLKGSEPRRLASAAAAAVAAALAMRGSARPEANTGLFVQPASSAISAWQTAQRANQLQAKSQRGPAR